MVSLCHGAIYGLGAYLYAAATVLFALPPLAATGLAMVGCAAFGLAVGAVTARTTGIFFIMATLAFGQMLYALVFESSYLGGDDGMSGVKRLDFSPLGIDLNDSLMFAGLCLIGAVVSYALIATVLRAAFGRALCGIHSNEDRMRSLGASTWKYKAVAFAVSATVAGFAGTLAAQHTAVRLAELLVWTVSGEALVVVILGGIGTLIGPAIGAVFLVLLKHEIGSYTDHWHGFIGLILDLHRDGRRARHLGAVAAAVEPAQPGAVETCWRLTTCTSRSAGCASPRASTCGCNAASGALSSAPTGPAKPRCSI